MYELAWARTNSIALNQLLFDWNNINTIIIVLSAKADILIQTQQKIDAQRINLNPNKQNLIE